MRRFFFFIPVLCIVSMIYSYTTFGFSTSVTGVESYPGKVDVKNINGLGKNISNDFFGGAMSFRYPFTFPTGSRGMTPTFELSYNSNNSDAFSPYGYGFSLTIPRIQRSAKKGVSELYIGDEFSAFGNDLIREESGRSLLYRSKDASDMNRYTRSGSSWIVETPQGRKLVFGENSTARIADPNDMTRVYAWLLQEEQDMFGHRVRYSYFVDGGQSYLSDISYGFDVGNMNPMYIIRFDYITKAASLTSHRTQFEITTGKLLRSISLIIGGKAIRGYEFTYDDPSSPISHLTSIAEVAENMRLPSVDFSYGEGQYSHLVHSIDNNRGGIAHFSYSPSTQYVTYSGELSNPNLPFIVYTLSRQVLEDTVTGVKTEQSYTYAGGHYYFDSSDIWGREYVGFREVTVTDRMARTILYFHQSQTSQQDLLKYQDDIAKKGRLYRTDIFDRTTGNILSTERMRYDMNIITPGRKLVYLSSKISSIFDENTQQHTDTAITYQVDTEGNIVEETSLGFVKANLENGTYEDIPGDSHTTLTTYTSNRERNLYHFPLVSKVYGYSGELLSENRREYDNTSSGVTTGLLTANLEVDVFTKQNFRESYAYSTGGLRILKKDQLGNIYLFTYDTRDIAPLYTINPQGWKVTYTYDYALGKTTCIENYNGLKSIQKYDVWGREVANIMDPSGIEIVLSETIYDDKMIPNSTVKVTYYDTSLGNNKTSKIFTDGWGRIISTVNSTETSGKFSLTTLRYDDIGNVIYTGFPIFTQSDIFDTTRIFSGSIDGESYRASSPGVSYSYDAIGRLRERKDAQGTTKKLYQKNTETTINPLGQSLTEKKNAFGNLIEFIEQNNGKGIITSYVYDALGRITLLRDVLGNIRSWKYDGLGHLQSTTDMHSPDDTTYGVRSYVYDVLGRLMLFTNSSHQQIRFSYDALSRVKTEQTETGSMRVYTYDRGNRSLGTLSSVVDSGSTVTFLYDELGRKILENRTIGNMQYNLSYTYNMQNLPISTIYPDAGKVEYTYKNGYIQNVIYTNPKGIQTPIVSQISYFPNTAIKSLQYGNGFMRDIERDQNNNYRLQSSKVIGGTGQTFLDTIYAYDILGRIINISEQGIEPLRKSISYSYDPLSRLVGANYDYTFSGFGRETKKNLEYRYNDIGNITYASHVGVYEYSGIGYANPHAVTDVNSYKYSYDPSGRMVARESASTNLNLTYSPYDEQLSSQRGNTITSYLYDHTHRRIAKSTPELIEHHVIDGFEVEYESGALIQNTLSTDTVTLPENQNTTSLLGVTQTGTIIITNPDSSTGSQVATGLIFTSSGASGATNVVIAGYTVSDMTGTLSRDLITTLTHIMLGDERVATFQSQKESDTSLSDSGSIIYHISDHLNSSSMDISSTGVLLQTTDILPFGERYTYEVTQKRIKGIKGGYTNKYLFANKQQDNETDLQYFEKRYYDNRIGKFTTQDPVFWEVGLTNRPMQYFVDPQQWNTYSYVRNNPINLVDPTGELLTYSEPVEYSNTYKVSYLDVGRNMGPEEMVAHYMFGYGTSVGVPFEEISLPKVTPEKFGIIQKHLKEGNAGTFDIQTNEADPGIGSLYTIGVLTDSIKDRSGHGNIRVIIGGRLTIDDKGNWDFTGHLRGAPDRYNFNKSNHRTIIGESSTTIGRNIPGKSYKVLFLGEKLLSGKGKIENNENTKKSDKK